jgi:galactofuranose transport system substrate-binding protein
MKLATRMVASGLMAAAFAFAAAPGHAQDKQITLGFAQVGAESAWRTANTVSI